MSGGARNNARGRGLRDRAQSALRPSLGAVLTCVVAATVAALPAAGASASGILGGPPAVLPALPPAVTATASTVPAVTPPTLPVVAPPVVSHAPSATATPGTQVLPSTTSTSRADAADGTLLAQDVLPGLFLLSPAPADPSTVLHVGFSLTRPASVVEAEDAYQRAVYDRASPDFHRFLTPAAFDQAFGEPASATAAVSSWLAGGGLTVSYGGGAGDWIQATGTVAQLSRLLGVTFATYQAGGTSFVANQQAPTVPAALGVADVVGLNTLQRFSVPATPDLRAALPAGASAALTGATRALTAATGATRAAATRGAAHRGHVATPAAVPSGPGCLPSCVYTPQDLWSLYDQPAQDEGQGVTMAVLGEGQTADVVANLRDFENAMKLPVVPVTVHDVGAGPFTDDSGQVEWDLDTQASTGMAPEAAGETLYFAASLADADVETALTSWVDDPKGPLQANASFGECETDPANAAWNAEPSALSQYVGDGDNLEPVAEATLEQATIEGRTLFAAAGDTGSSCPLAALPGVGAGNGVLNQAQPMLNYPCDSDYAVCVGGTVLYSDGAASPSRQLEYAWPYTGGGSSAFVAEPAFQQGVAAVDHPCLVGPGATPYPPGTICRGAPDVAAMSGDIATNAYDIYADGAASTEGGTSLSSPLWVGMWTRVQAASSHRGGLGFADPTFYAVGDGLLGHYARDFYDVTLGTNGLYTAGPGWDYVSGWGAPDVTNLTMDLDGTLVPRHDVPPKGGGGPPPHLACGVVWQNPPHTATDLVGNSDPQLSLLEGTMGSTPGHLVVGLKVTDLSATVPTGATAEDWYATWSYGGTTYFAQAQLGATPGAAVTYDDGTVTTTGGTSTYQAAHTVTGTFTPGPDGTVTISVPLGDVGNPPAGTVLAGPAGATFTEEGVPPTPAGLGEASLQHVDSGGPTAPYTVGRTCRSTGAA